MVKEKEAKKANKKKRRLISAIAITAVLILVVALFYAVPTIMNSQRENITDFDDYDYTNLSGDKAFLFSVDSGEIKDVVHIGDSVCVVTSNSVITLKKNGEVINTQKLGYSSPVIKFSEKNYMVFERSTGKYTVIDKKGNTYSAQLEGAIINADISKSGNYVIINQDKVSSVLVTVYSPKNEILFRWECNETYLTNCAISPDGKKFSVSSFDVKNGEQVTKVLSFTVKSTGIEKEISCENDVIYSMKYLSGDTVGIVTDNRYIVTSDKKDEIKTGDYEYDVLTSHYFAVNNSLGILKSDFGSLDKTTATVYDRGAETAFGKEINEKVIDFCMDKSFVYVMTPCKITLYAISTGEEYSVIETVGGLKHIDVLSGKLICSDDRSIYKYEK